MDLQQVNMMQLREAALAYGHMGVRILPLRPKEKLPLMASHGVHDATDDINQITEWWDMDPNRNIGLVTSGTVLDVDARSGGLETFGELCDEYGFDWYGSDVSDTPTGGCHLLLGPADLCVPLRGIDVIPAGRKYIVAPPSVHPLGGMYQWRAGATLVGDFPEFPEWLKPPPMVLRHVEREAPDNVKQYAQAALHREVMNVRKASAGGRNTVLNKAAYNLFRLVADGGIDEQDIGSNLLQAALHAGLPMAEAKRTILSAMHARLK